MKLTVILMLAALVVGCSKDPVSTSVTTQSGKRILFSPDTLHGITYAYLTMKARVDGLAVSDAYLNWEFAEMGSNLPHSHLEASKPITDIYYLTPGSHRIRVNAYDVFNDTLIASDSTLAVITPSTNALSLLPRSCDTSLIQNPDGSVMQEMSFVVQHASTNNFYTYEIHVVGSGIDSVIESPIEQFDFHFPALGTYKVVVTAKDQRGALYGSDSGTYNIILRPPDLQTLMACKAVGVELRSTFQMGQTFFKGDTLLAGSILFHRDSIHTASMDAAGFSLTADIQFGTPGQHLGDHDTIRGTFSTDRSTLLTFAMSNADTSYNNAISGWGFQSRNVRLLSVTDSSIIYAIRGVPAAFVVNNGYSYLSGPAAFREIFDSQSAFDPIQSTATGRIIVEAPSLYVMFRR